MRADKQLAGRRVTSRPVSRGQIMADGLRDGVSDGATTSRVVSVASVSNSHAIVPAAQSVVVCTMRCAAVTSRWAECRTRATGRGISADVAAASMQISRQ